ncbi:MAG: arginase [Anaerolineae bacterium]
MQIHVIGVPMDLGAGRRGVDMGPSAIRYAGLIPALETLDCAIYDQGNIEVPVSEAYDETETNLRYLEPIIAVVEQLGAKVTTVVEAGHFPLILGGDHSLALGSIRGVAQGRRLGLLWIDAHADFNTAETSPSGNIHGMPLAALTGYGDPRLVALLGGPLPVVEPAKVAVIGVRQLDPEEHDRLRQAGITVFAMEQIDRIRLYEALRQALDIATRDTDGIYVSFDLDALDPLYAPGVGTPVQGGLTYREAHLACEMIAETGRMVGLELVEVNPILDERNKTAEMAVELALSALGKRVW